MEIGCDRVLVYLLEGYEAGGTRLRVVAWNGEITRYALKKILGKSSMTTVQVAYRVQFLRYKYPPGISPTS